MPKITAYVVIGVIELEGFEPRNWAYLVEGQRPEWFIAPPGYYSPEDQAMFKSNWLSSPETLVDDLMLAVAMVVENKRFLALDILRVTESGNGEVVDLGKIPKARRQELVRLNQGVKHDVHMVVTILTESLMNDQFAEFMRHNVPVEVCTASYSQDGSFSTFKGRDDNPDAYSDDPRRN